MVEADPLICCARYGGPDRNSDPTIGASVNALARLGAYVTLRNPVGLYIDHIDLAGWEGPKGEDVSGCVRIVRGMPQMIERLVVEVPSERGFCVGDIRIGGVPIQYGGQIAECITVKLVGIANLQTRGIVNDPASCDGRCCIDPNYPNSLKRPIPIDAYLPSGMQAAYSNQGELETAGIADATKDAAQALSSKSVPRHHRPVPAATRTRIYIES